MEWALGLALVAAERLPVPVRVAQAPAALRDRMVRAVHPALAARLDPAVVTAREVPAVLVGLLVLVAPLARVDPLAPPAQAAQDRPVLVDLPAQAVLRVQADPRGQEVQPDPAARPVQVVQPVPEVPVAQQDRAARPAAIPAPLAGSRQAVRRSSGQVGRALWST